MTQEEFRRLLDRYTKGKSSPEEARFFDRFVEGMSAQPTEWDQETKERLRTDIFNRIQQKIRQEDQRAKVLNINITRWTRAAAAATLALLLSSLLYWTIQQAGGEDSTFSQNENVTEQVKQISLADGTLVWLNRNSQIYYEKSFNDSIREVRLEGEAFFQVTRDSSRPFVVVTGDVQTRVLGTSFNVKAFPDRSTVSVALVEGLVNVEVTEASRGRYIEKLVPGEVFFYEKVEKQSRKENFNSDAPYAWRDEVISFDRANVREVAQTLQDWYQIKITIQQENLIQDELVHRFDTRKLDLEEVLKGISLVSNYQFMKVKEAEYVIIPK